MIEVLGVILIAIGVLFDIFGCIGLIRLPDVYNRIQSSTKCVTVGTCLPGGVSRSARFAARHGEGHSLHRVHTVDRADRGPCPGSCRSPVGHRVVGTERGGQLRGR